MLKTVEILYTITVNRQHVLINYSVYEMSLDSSASRPIAVASCSSEMLNSLELTMTPPAAFSNVTIFKRWDPWPLDLP